MDVVPATFEVEKFDGVPQEFKKARFMAPLLKGYWVTLFCFFDGERIHHIFHQSEMLDNAQLARECGFSLTEFLHKVLVTPHVHPEIFNKIESYVSRSNSD